MSAKPCHPDCVICNKHREPHDFIAVAPGRPGVRWIETHPTIDDAGRGWVEYLREPLVA